MERLDGLCVLCKDAGMESELMSNARATSSEGLAGAPTGMLSPSATTEPSSWRFTLAVFLLLAVPHVAALWLVRS